TTSAEDIPVENKLIDSAGNIHVFNSNSPEPQDRLTIKKILENKISVINPIDWLLLSVVPVFRNGSTTKLSYETWEFFDALSPTRGVGGNANIEGLYIGEHTPFKALSYGRARMSIF